MTNKTVPERVRAFLQENRGTAFCDDCIKSKNGLERRQQAQSVTATLAGQGGFTRSGGLCQACQSHRSKLLTKFG